VRTTIWKARSITRTDGLHSIRADVRWRLGQGRAPARCDDRTRWQAMAYHWTGSEWQVDLHKMVEKGGKPGCVDEQIVITTRTCVTGPPVTMRRHGQAVGDQNPPHFRSSTSSIVTEARTRNCRLSGQWRAVWSFPLLCAMPMRNCTFPRGSVAVILGPSSACPCAVCEYGVPDSFPCRPVSRLGSGADRRGIHEHDPFGLPSRKRVGLKYFNGPIC